MATIDVELPENCVAHILDLTSPPDACRFAVVSNTFYCAAGSDTVWERFLPPDHREILSQAVQPPTFSSKELYFRLCDPILINGGEMSFELERSSGKKCFMISARELVIRRDTGGGSLRLIPGSQRLQISYLYAGWRFVGSSLREFSPQKQLIALILFTKSLKSHMASAIQSRHQLKVGTNVSERRVYLALDEHSNGWEKLEVGEFFIDEGDEGEVDVSLMEVNGGHWKNGLIVQGIEVRPKK